MRMGSGSQIPHVFFTLSTGGFQIVQAEMGDNRGEIGLWRLNGGWIRLLITQVSILSTISSAWLAYPVIR